MTILSEDIYANLQDNLFEVFFLFNFIDITSTEIFLMQFAVQLAKKKKSHYDVV